MASHLGVRVTESGSRSFIVVRRRPGQLNPDTHVIGKFPAVKLKDASAAVPAILEMLSEGKIPREVEAERRRVADTFGAAVADFIADGALAGLRSGRETEAILRREFLGQTWERVERDGLIDFTRPEPIKAIQ